jgi:surface protein
MFRGCQSITSLDAGGFNTVNVEDMRLMFSYCTALVSLDIGHFDTSKVIDMREAFSYCRALPYLDISSFNINSVTMIDDMFKNCSALTRIYVSEHWNTTSVTSSDNMFYGCTNLVGGNGTTYDSTIIDSTRACIDTPENAGYLTYAEPVSMRINLITEGTLRGIARAIRRKNKATDIYLPSEMYDAILEIETANDLINAEGVRY